MGWSGSDFQRTHNFSADASAGIDILASRMDAEFDNFEQGLEACLKIDGTNAPAADFAMAGYKHTNVGAAASTNQYLRLDQFQQFAPIYAAYGGTAEAMQGSTNPTFAALVTGHTVYVSCPSANATSATLAVNGLSAHPVRTPTNGAIAAGAVKGLRQYSYRGDYWALMNEEGGTTQTSTTFQSTVFFSGSVTFGSTVNFDGAMVVSGSASFTSATVYDGDTQRAIGYLDLPVVAFDIGRSLSINDRSKLLYHATTSASQLVLPSSSDVALPVGAAIFLLTGPSSGVVSVSAGSGVTIYRIGTGSTGSRYLSAANEMQAKKVAADTWFVNGTGLK